MPERTRRSLYVSSSFIVLLLMVLAASAWHRIAAAAPERRLYPPVDGENQVMRTGKEIVLVFIGSAKCGASGVPGLPAAMDSIRASVARYAAASGSRFSTLGVAVDQQPNDGLLFLEKFGAFDQVAVGHNWLNAAAISYIWRESPGPSSLPQVVVLERQLTVETEGVSISPDHLIARKTGSAGLLQWAAAGAPLR